MITIKVNKKAGDYVQFLSTGHAGYSEEGSDIICAAVSALIINTMNSIEQFTDDSFEEETKDGYVKVSFPDGMSDKGRLLMDSLILGLTFIEQNNNQYLTVKIREV
ncbi:MAG: ribosomal-processing cysteine protease Prp [Eubacteriales bacterium]|nr:ribosomal-processing cysteine protease Prp [Eubacteriales bacterium]